MFVLLFFLITCLPCHAYLVQEANYVFKTAPIDVVIVCDKKDVDTLDLCIKGIKKFGKGVRRVVVISKKCLTKEAEWFDQNKFPFTEEDVARSIFETPAVALQFVHDFPDATKMIYKKLLKLYAAFLIEDLSQNILLLDPQTIFLRPVRFVKNKHGLFTAADGYHAPHFTHMRKLISWLKKVSTDHSGCAHHMLIQKPVLKDLFDTIQKEHRKLCWKALIQTIDSKDLLDSPISEYEIYLNFALMRSSKFKIRQLKWKNISSLSEIDYARLEDYHFVYLQPRNISSQ